MRKQKIKEIMLRLKRYIRFATQYFLYEKPQGLDFYNERYEVDQNEWRNVSRI